MTISSLQPQIILASMPWAIFSRPSIQLGCLKSYIEQSTGYRVTTLHPYLDVAKAIGLANYNIIADNSWAGETLFSALLFPAQKEKAKKVFKESLGQKRQQLPEFESLLISLEECCQQWIEQIEWHKYQLAGFSLCFSQLLASLYIAAQIKQKQDCPPIVFGGSSCGGALGTSLMRSFSQIDYIIDGEGEKPLAGLCNYLSGDTPQFPTRVLSRQTFTNVTPAPEIADINTLPVPDYSSYFQELRRIFPDTPFIPSLPLEFSRGCWWNKCTFCNLNLQWCGYRWKKAAKVTEELEQLATAYQCLDYTFTDNALPPREAELFFDAVADSGADYRFFAEIRGITEPETLKRHRHGGLDTIQVGIESLCDSLLAKMKKGISVIENIAIMKYSMAAGIVLEGNIIVEFPGSTSEEVSKTVETLEYVRPYRPLSPATFFLGHGSPIDKDPVAYGIKAVTRHRKNRALFPKELFQNLDLLTKEYRGDRQKQRILWQPVRDSITDWQCFHAHRHSTVPCALSYRDGGSFLIIRQEMQNTAPLLHRFQGLSRAIYLFCDEIRTIPEICVQFKSLKESAILAFIHQLCQKRLMFRENDRILSLAIHRQ
jgi:ribosomal peptide maturation radical SAM protein 1